MEKTMDRKSETSYGRLCIFVFYDPCGIVDDYVPYLLNDLKKNVDRLLVVVNGNLSKAGNTILHSITEDVVIRENTGYDFFAWRYALLEVLGWDEVSSYNELVLLNDSSFGPFRPFSEVFSEMSGKTDFWGLVAHGELKGVNPFGICPYGYLPSHLQSSFLVIGSKMLHNEAFKRYWVEMLPAKNYQEAVARFECVFTKHFADLGFSWAAFVDAVELDGVAPTAHSFFSPYQLLLRGMPTLKVKAFAQDLDDLLNVHMGDDLSLGMAYIRDKTDYDIGMIYQHVLRRGNIADIHDTLHLDYVVPAYAEEMPIKHDHPKTLVLLHLYYMDLLESERQYIESIPSYMDVLITTITEEQRQAIQNAYSSILGSRLRVILMQNRGREAASLLVAARPYFSEYEYICFCQDKKSSQVPYVTGASFSRLGWENMLCSKTYIENIIKLFEHEKYLGLLVPPRFFGGAFLYNLPTNLWTICFERTVEVAKMLGLKVNISRDKGIICTNSMFWARVKALKPLLNYDWKYTDFEKEPTPVDGAMRHVVERILQFVAQDTGYYTGIVMTQEYAAIQTNAFYHLTKRGLQREMQLRAEVDSLQKQPRLRRKRMRDKLYSIMPPRLWRIFSKIYHFFGGRPLS